MQKYLIRKILDTSDLLIQRSASRKPSAQAFSSDENSQYGVTGADALIVD